MKQYFMLMKQRFTFIRFAVCICCLLLFSFTFFSFTTFSPNLFSPNLFSANVFADDLVNSRDFDAANLKSVSLLCSGVSTIVIRGTTEKKAKISGDLKVFENIALSSDGKKLRIMSRVASEIKSAYKVIIDLPNNIAVKVTCGESNITIDNMQDALAITGGEVQLQAKASCSSVRLEAGNIKKAEFRNLKSCDVKVTCGQGNISLFYDPAYLPQQSVKIDVNQGAGVAFVSLPQQSLVKYFSYAANVKSEFISAQRGKNDFYIKFWGSQKSTLEIHKGHV